MSEEIEDTTPKEGDDMNAIAIATALEAGIRIIDLVFKYNSDMAVPTDEELAGHIERVRALAPLQEDYDEGIVTDTLNYIKEKLGIVN
jgi:hypothetical protein